MRIQFLPDGSLFVLIITNKVVININKNLRFPDGSLFVLIITNKVVININKNLRFPDISEVVCEIDLHL